MKRHTHKVLKFVYFGNLRHFEENYKPVSVIY